MDDTTMRVSMTDIVPVSRFIEAVLELADAELTEAELRAGLDRAIARLVTGMSGLTG